MILAILNIVDMLLRVSSDHRQVVFSWLVAFNVLNTSSKGVRTLVGALEKVTGPLYRPIRRIMPDFGGIDFSPLVLLLLIWVISRLLGGVERWIFSAAITWAHDGADYRRKGSCSRPSKACRGRRGHFPQ